MDPNQKKVCAKCGEPKPLAEYFRRSRAKDGLQSYCKSCHRAVMGPHKAAWEKKFVYRCETLADGRRRRWRELRPVRMTDQGVLDTRGGPEVVGNDLVSSVRFRIDDGPPTLSPCSPQCSPPSSG